MKKKQLFEICEKFAESIWHHYASSFTHLGLSTLIYAVVISHLELSNFDFNDTDIDQTKLGNIAYKAGLVVFEDALALRLNHIISGHRMAQKFADLFNPQ